MIINLALKVTSQFFSYSSIFSQGNDEASHQPRGQEDEGQESEHESANGETRAEEVEDDDANKGGERQEEEGEDTTGNDQRDAADDSIWQCDICDVCCRSGSHLRRSKECLKQLKDQPQFQFKGSQGNEVFIVKFCLIKGECPSSCCLTGRHTEFPQSCLEWWKSEGWGSMGWRGDRENADAHMIKEKIRKFVQYHQKKSTPQGQPEAGTQVSQAAGTQVSQAPTECEDRCKCRSCGGDGDLIQHLYERSQCLGAYIQHYLTVTDGEVDIEKSIFQLSIVLNMCARVECAQKTSFTYLGPHLTKNKECLAFYQNKGVNLALPNWTQEVSASMIGKKIAQMKRAINEAKTREQSIGCASYREELSKLLCHVCLKCGAMGPDLGEEDFALRGGWTHDDGQRGWFCAKCTEESPEFPEVKQKLEGETERLKGQRDSQESDLKVVMSPTGRLIVAPRSLALGSLDVPQYATSLSTLVLVPSHPSAIRANMGWCDDVLKDKSELKKCVHELLKRPFITNFLPTMSCLYRSLLADVRQQMERISMGVSKVARGEVLSYNPNITSARKQVPNIEVTIEGAMRDRCRWSFPSERQRASESEARSIVNGQVKLQVRGTILMGIEDEELQRIMLLGCKSFVNENLTSMDNLLGDPNLEPFIIKMAPVILKYVRSKVKLFIKHVVAPNFSNHDLRLHFDDHKLKIEIHGYVYARQFSQVNRMLAADPTVRLLPEVTSRVTMEEEVLPTTTLDWRQVAAVYNFEELRAKAVVDVAHRCQIGDVVFPLSLLNIWTPSGWMPSEEEKVLRNRAEELSHERDDGEDVEEAILDITRILQDEGLFEELVFEDVDCDIKQSMRKSLVEMCPHQPRGAVNGLMWYHMLLLRTGGKNQWTWKRNCGETLVVAYHPLLLEALQERTEVRVAVETEFWEPESSCDEDSPEDPLMGGFAWKEVSILKFLDGVSKEKFEEPVSQATVTVITRQEHELKFKDSDERDEECDDVFVNSKDESFIITNGDLKKLYAKRPEARGVKDMLFGQFIVDYYRKQPRQPAIIDHVSGVGEESEEPIVGGDCRAPLAMKLSNNVIMKKRCETVKPVPLLLRSNTLDRYGERMLFQPWRNDDELLQPQSEEDKEKQRQNRLELFPMAIFPGVEDGSRRRSEERKSDVSASGEAE